MCSSHFDNKREPSANSETKDSYEPVLYRNCRVVVPQL